MSPNPRDEPSRPRDPEDPRPGPLALALALERSALVVVALQGLSPLQLEVFTAVYGIGRPSESVAYLAARLRCRRDVVRRVCDSAVRSLDDALRGDVAPE
jgi:DNA-directed RNA polymerase specialized sigma24 family protein